MRTPVCKAALTSFGTGSALTLFALLIASQEDPNKARLHTVKSSVFPSVHHQGLAGQWHCCLCSRPASASEVAVEYRCSVPNAGFPSPSCVNSNFQSMKLTITYGVAANAELCAPLVKGSEPERGEN